MRVTVLGITGYTGKELLKLLLGHPEISEIIPVSASQPGVPISHIHRSFPKHHPKFARTDYKTVSLDYAQNIASDTLFSCLPHRHSAAKCLLFAGKTKIIDLSADFRLEAQTYETLYETAFPQLPPGSTRAYGLCELYRDSIKSADIVAVPGCFAGTILSVLLPLYRHKQLPQSASCVALTGISGAGKQASEQFSFCERNENISAYAPIRQHRHVPEIEEKLDNTLRLSVTPVLTPVQRGIYAIISMQSKNAEQLIATIEDYYADEAFVVCEKDRIPSLSDVLYTNNYRIGAHYTGESLQFYACSDNLLKGASGQAVQCFNILHNVSETLGLQNLL